MKDSSFLAFPGPFPSFSMYMYVEKVREPMDEQCYSLKGIWHILVELGRREGPHFVGRYQYITI